MGVSRGASAGQLATRLGVIPEHWRSRRLESERLAKLLDDRSTASGWPGRRRHESGEPCGFIVGQGDGGFRLINVPDAETHLRRLFVRAQVTRYAERLLTIGFHVRMRGEEFDELRPQRHRAPGTEAEPPLDAVPTVGTRLHSSILFPPRRFCNRVRSGVIPEHWRRRVAMERHFLPWCTESMAMRVATLLLVLSSLGCSNSDTAAQNEATTASPAQEAATVEGCPVTKPNGSTPPGETSEGLRHHGNGSLWTVLHYPTLPVTARNRQPDGSIDEKFPWWRGVSGNLSIRGRRIDGSAPPLRARIPSGYGDSGFQASAIIFPTEGCWRVTGSVGLAALTFVVLVRG